MTITPSLPNSGLVYLGHYRPHITVGAQLVNPISLETRRRIMISLMMLILPVSWDIGFLTRNTSLTPERVNNRRTLDIATLSTIMSSSRKEDTPSVGTSLAPVSNSIYLIIPIQRKTRVGVCQNVVVLPSIFTRPRRRCISRWSLWRSRIKWCSS